MTHSLDLLEIGYTKGEVKYTTQCVEKFSAILNSVLKEKKKTAIGDALIHLLTSPDKLSIDEYELLCNATEDWDIKQEVQSIMTKRVLYTNIDATTKLPDIHQYYKVIKDKLYQVSQNEGFDKGKTIAKQPDKVLELLKKEGISGKANDHHQGSLQSIPFGLLHKASVSIDTVNGENIKREKNTHYFGNIILIKQNGDIFKLGDSPFSIVIGYEEKMSTSGKNICIIKTLDDANHFFHEDGTEFTTFGVDNYDLIDYKGIRNKAPKEYFPDGIADQVSIKIGNDIWEYMLFDKNGIIPQTTINNQDFFVSGTFNTIDNIYNGRERDQRSKAMGIHKIAVLTNNIGQRNQYALDKDGKFIPLFTTTGEERYLLSNINTYEENKTWKKWNDKVRYQGTGVNKQGETKRIRFNKEKQLLTSGDLVEDIVEFDTVEKGDSIRNITKTGEEERLFASVVRNEKGEERKVWLGGDKLYKIATQNPCEEIIDHTKNHPITVSGGFGSSYTKKIAYPKILATKDSVIKRTTRRKDGTERNAYRYTSGNQVGSLCYPGGEEKGYLVDIIESNPHIFFGNTQKITLEQEDGCQQQYYLTEKGNFLPTNIVSLGIQFNHLQLGRIQEITVNQDNKDITTYINEKGEEIDNIYFNERIEPKREVQQYHLFGKEIKFVHTDNNGYSFIGEDNNPIYFGDNKTEKLVSYNINEYGSYPIRIYDTDENTKQHGLAIGLLALSVQKTKKSKSRSVLMNKSGKIIHCQMKGEQKEIRHLGNYCFNTPTGEYILTADIDSIKEEILVQRSGDIITPQTFGFDLDYICNGKSREDSKRLDDGTVIRILPARKNNKNIYVELTWKPRGKLGDGKLLYNQNPTINITKGKLEKA